MFLLIVQPASQQPIQAITTRATRSITVFRLDSAIAGSPSYLSVFHVPGARTAFTRLILVYVVAPEKQKENTQFAWT